MSISLLKDSAIESEATVTNVAYLSPSRKKQLILADGLCPKIANLLSGALHETVALGTADNPLVEITNELAKRRLLGQPVQTLHLVAHGRPGAFLIGGQWVDKATLLANANQISKWQVRHIALWSCEVGLDVNFIYLLAELTGSQIFSATEHVGSLLHGNNWILQSHDYKSIISGEILIKEEIRNIWSGQLTTKIAVFNQSGLNGGGVGDDSDENANLLSIIQKQIDDGKDYQIESGITSFTIPDLVTRLADSSFFFMTDMESGSPSDNDFLPDTAVNDLKTFVENGGIIVMTGTNGSADVDFLNRIFNWDLGSEFGDTWDLNPTEAAGTPFSQGPTSLTAPSATDSISSGTVSGFQPIYGNSSNATVAVIPFGLGKVIFMGFDFYATGYATDYGQGTHVNGFQNTDNWVTQILPLSLEYAVALSTPVDTPPIITSGNIFTIAENTTLVGAVTAADPDLGTTLGYGLIGGVDKDRLIIDAITGALSFISAPNYEKPVDINADNIYEVEVQVTDGTNTVTQDIVISVIDSDEGFVDYSQEQLDELKGTVSLLKNSTFSVTLSNEKNTNTASVNELVAFVVEDENGTVNGITPGADGFDQNAYIQEILNSDTTQIILSNLASSDNQPETFKGVSDNLIGSASFTAGTRVAFLLVTNGTSDELQKQNGSSNIKVFFSNQNGALVDIISNQSFNLSFNELGDLTSPNLIFNVAATDVDPDALVASDKFQELSITLPVLVDGGIDFIEAFDFRNFDHDGDGLVRTGGRYSVQVNLYSEAIYDNLLGFVAINSVDGSINGIVPGIANREQYLQQVLDNLLGSISDIQTESVTQFTFVVDANSVVIPVLISDSPTPNGNYSNVLTPFSSLNPENSDHFRHLGNGIYGIEDMIGGGDRDFNDIIIAINTVNQV